MKYTPTLLHKIENLFAESDYILRYEKGNFQAGWCVLNSNKVILVNSYYPLDGKINSLLEILRSVELEISRFSPKSLQLYKELSPEKAEEAIKKLAQHTLEAEKEANENKELSTNE